MKDFEHLMMLYGAAQAVVANWETNIAGVLESIADDWQAEEAEQEEVHSCE